MFLKVYKFVRITTLKVHKDINVLKIFRIFFNIHFFYIHKSIIFKIKNLKKSQIIAPDDLDILYGYDKMRTEVYIKSDFFVINF